MCLLWQNMSFVMTKVCLLQQNICHDKHRTACLSRQKFCRNKHNFVTTKVLSRQAYLSHDKRRVLSRQTHVYRNNTCRDKNDTCGSCPPKIKIPPVTNTSVTAYNNKLDKPTSKAFLFVLNSIKPEAKAISANKTSGH